jgi:hypothetical protein
MGCEYKEWHVNIDLGVYVDVLELSGFFLMYYFYCKTAVDTVPDDAPQRFRTFEDLTSKLSASLGSARWGIFREVWGHSLAWDPPEVAFYGYLNLQGWNEIARDVATHPSYLVGLYAFNCSSPEAEIVL